jgi:hypothetical protein
VTPQPLPSDLIQDPRTDPTATSCNKRIVFAGDWLEWAFALKRNAKRLHEKLGATEYSAADLFRLAHAAETAEPDPAAVVDLQPEMDAISRLQAELGSRFTISGGEAQELTTDGVSTPEWFDQIDEIPFEGKE